MLQKQKFINGLTAGLIAASVAVCGSVAKADTLRWLTWKTESAGDAQTANIKWFVDEFEKRVKGKHKVQIMWGGSAAAQKEIPDAISNGVGQIGEIVLPYYMNKFVINNAVGYFTPQPMGPAELGDLMGKWHDDFPQFEAEMAKYNLKAVGFRPLEKYGILCKEPIRKLEDFKGRKIRTYGSAYPALVKALGGIPVGVSTTEAYQALERGILDCTPTSLTYVRGFKFEEVAKYFTDVPFGANYGHFVVMNLKYYNSLDAETRKVIDDLGRQNAANFVSQVDPIVAKLKAEWAKDPKGVEVIDFPQDAFKEAVKDPAIQKLRNSWIEKANAAGLPGDKIADMMAFK
jgi:TRAP-type C4-dicarboxylate transport system substrate-binding protein